MGYSSSSPCSLSLAVSCILLCVPLVTHNEPCANGALVAMIAGITAIISATTVALIASWSRHYIRDNYCHSCHPFRTMTADLWETIVRRARECGRGLYSSIVRSTPSCFSAPARIAGRFSRCAVNGLVAAPVDLQRAMYMTTLVLPSCVRKPFDIAFVYVSVARNIYDLMRPSRE